MVYNFVHMEPARSRAAKDRLRIADVQAGLAWAAHLRDCAEFAAYFVPTGVFDGPLGRFEGRDEIERFIAMLSSRWGTGTSTQVWTGPSTIKLQSSSARVRSFTIVLIRDAGGAVCLPWVGSHEDLMTYTDGQWRVETRVSRPWGGRTFGAWPAYRPI